VRERRAVLAAGRHQLGAGRGHQPPHLIQGGQPPEVFEQALAPIAAGGLSVARNIEIKARIASVEACCRARGLADGDPSSSTRTTASSAVPHGRLKLRRLPTAAPS
jgi:hypothetical protein